MPVAADKYKETLIRNILSASSQEQVKNFIDTAFRAMERDKVNNHFIVRFIGKAISDLESFNPMKEQPQQWDNIKVAKILLNRKWIGLNTPTD